MSRIQHGDSNAMVWCSGRGRADLAARPIAPDLRE